MFTSFVGIKYKPKSDWQVKLFVLSGPMSVPKRVSKPVNKKYENFDLKTIEHCAAPEHLNEKDNHCIKNEFHTG